jgi:hypothetical protein
VRLLFRWLRRLIYLLIVAAVVFLVVCSVQVVSASKAPRGEDAVVPANAIVVVGSATGTSGISPDLKARCEQAGALFDAHKAPLVITTGGAAHPGDPAEASVAAAYLRAHTHGITHLVEVAGATVPAQLAAVRRLLAKSHEFSVILVIDPLQAKWLRGVSTAENLRAQLSPGPAPKASFWDDLGRIWVQTAAVAFGRIVGYQHTGWIGG